MYRGSIDFNISLHIFHKYIYQNIVIVKLFIIAFTELVQSHFFFFSFGCECVCVYTPSFDLDNTRESLLSRIQPSGFSMAHSFELILYTYLYCVYVSINEQSQVPIT